MAIMTIEQQYGVPTVSCNVSGESGLYFKLKRNLNGDNEDTTVVTINSYELSQSKTFAFTDYLVTSNGTYTYSLYNAWSLLLTSSSVTIQNDYDKLHIVSGTSHILTEFEYEYDLQHNFNTSVINTLGSRFPFIIRNSSINYRSGSMTIRPFAATNNGYVYDNTWKAFDAAYNILNDGKAKIIKMPEGRTLVVAVTGSSIKEDYDKHIDNKSIEFEYTEVGEITTNMTTTELEELKGAGVTVLNTL